MPRDGRRATSSTRSPAQTPVALTTARAETVAVPPVSSSRSSTPVPVAVTTRARVRMWAPWPAAVRATVVTSRASSSSWPSHDSRPPRSPSRRSPGASVRASVAEIRRGSGQGVAAGVGAAPEEVAGDQRAASHRRLNTGDAGRQRDQHRHRVREVGGGHLHQDPALDRALVGDADLPVGEVAQTTVDQLRGPAGRAEREVVGVHGQDRQPPGDGVERDTGAGDPEADDDQVDVGRDVGQAGRDPGGRQKQDERVMGERPGEQQPQLGIELGLGDVVVDHGVRREHVAVGGQQEGAGDGRRVAGADRSGGLAGPDLLLGDRQDRVLGATPAGEQVGQQQLGVELDDAQEQLVVAQRADRPDDPVDEARDRVAVGLPGGDRSGDDGTPLAGHQVAQQLLHVRPGAVDRHPRDPGPAGDLGERRTPPADVEDALAGGVEIDVTRLRVPSPRCYEVTSCVTL